MLVPIAVSLASIAVFIALWPRFFAPKKYSFSGKHVVISGASQGLGRDTAIELAKKGAHVVVLARREHELKEVVEAAKAVRQNQDQKIAYFVCDVTQKEAVAEVYEKIVSSFGVPEVIIPCAGTSVPKLFLEATLEEYDSQMQLNYFGSLYLAHIGAKKMKETGVRGKIVFVSSTMAVTAFPGYGPYAPTKWALRGLFDTLVTELELYGISCHMAYPPSMDTPGFKEENKVKPQLTKNIEGVADVFKPVDIARALVAGVEAGDKNITFDLITEILRIAAGGTSFRRNVLLEATILPLLAVIATLLTYNVKSSVSAQAAKDKKK